MEKKFLTLVGLAAAVSLYGVNLVPGDTSFETEPDTLTSGIVSPGYLPFAWDENEAFHGKRSLRVDWDRKNRWGTFVKTATYWVDKHLGFDTVDLEMGKTYTFSFYAKAKHKGATIGVMLMPNAFYEHFIKGSTVVKTNIPLTSEWKRIAVPFTVRYRTPAAFNGYCCLFRFQESNAGQYWIDAVQVEPGDTATEYKPSTPMHCGIRMDVPEGQGDIRNTMWAAYYTGDKITGMLRVRSNDGGSGKLTVRTIDWRGRTVSEFIRDNVKEADIPLSYDPDLRGWFKTVAAITRNGKEIVRHSANFMVIDRPAETAPGVEPFLGMISHHFMLPLMKRIGVKGFQVSQSWRVGYDYGLEPEKGKYDFRNLDLQVREAQKYGMKIKFDASAMKPPVWYFSPEEMAEAKKTWPSDELLVSKASMEAWKKRVNALLERYGDKMDFIELGAEDDGRLGSNAYYKRLHPEWVEEGKVCKGEAFELLNDTAAELADMIRKKYPRLKVSPIRPSGGVGGDPWTYVIKAFDRVGKHFNEFGLDCYLFYPYHVGPDIKSVNADLDGREWTMNRVQQMIRRNGGHHKIYMSEASLRGDTRYLDESIWEQKRAILMAKDFMICRALGLYAYYVYDCVGGHPHKQYDFKFHQNHKVQIGLPAICQTTQLVENTVKARYIRQPGSGRITLFKKYDGSGTAGIWADDGYFFQPADPKAVTVMDMMGNPIKPDKDGRYLLDTAPIQVKGANYEAMENSILKGELGQLGGFCRIYSDVKRKNTLTVELENTSSRNDRQIRVTVSSNAGTHSKDTIIPAGGYRRITLPASGTEAEISVLNRESNALIREKVMLSIPIAVTAKPVQFASVSERMQMVPSDPWAPWHGPDDLSAKFYASWNGQYLMVDVQVKDDIHRAVKRDAWECDSVQIAIDPRSNAGFLKKMNRITFNETIHEVCVALTADGRQNRYFSFGRKDLLDAPDACVITRDEKTKQTLYRFRIPWAKMKLKPEKGRVFGMSLAIFDDDTGTGKEILTEVGGGIIGKKDPRRYLKFVLE